MKLKLLYKNKYSIPYLVIFSIGVSVSISMGSTLNVILNVFNYKDYVGIVAFCFIVVGGITGSIVYMRYLIIKK